jgi:hypothetical protein
MPGRRPISHFSDVLGKRKERSLFNFRPCCWGESFISFAHVHFMTRLSSSMLSQVVAFLTCIPFIREVLGSNLGGTSTILTDNFRGFPQSIQASDWIVP